MMKKTDLAWAAGIIDGEGCITISKYTKLTRKTPDYELRVQVSMTCKHTINRLQRIFLIGSLYTGKTSRGRKIIMWYVKNSNAKMVLSCIQPFCTTKQKQVQLALQFLTLPKRRRGPIAVSAREVQKRERYFRKMKELKR